MNNSRVLGAARVGRGLIFGAANAPDWVARGYRGTDKHEHGYIEHYRRHFGPLRFRRLLVFEIGVGSYNLTTAGGSLPMWRDYFMRSTIVGLDITEKDIAFGPRVHFEQADQNEPRDLERVVEQYGQPDIVIDDGSHVAEHIRTSFETLWPVLRRGGIYAIEDLSTSYYPQFGGDDPPPAGTALGLLRSLIDDVQAHDPTFALHPEWGARETRGVAEVASVHVYPGLAVIEKRG